MENNELSNENFTRAIQIIRSHKAFQKTFNEYPAQTKVVIALVLPLFTGLPFYSFLSNNPLGQLIGYSLISFILGWIIYRSTQSPAEKDDTPRCRQTGRTPAERVSHPSNPL